MWEVIRRSSLRHKTTGQHRQPTPGRVTEQNAAVLPRGGAAGTFHRASGCASRMKGKSIYHQLPIHWHLKPVVKGAPLLLTVGLLMLNCPHLPGHLAPHHRKVLGQHMRTGCCAEPLQHLKSKNFMKERSVFWFFFFNFLEKLGYLATINLNFPPNCQRDTVWTYVIQIEKVSTTTHTENPACVVPLS